MLALDKIARAGTGRERPVQHARYTGYLEGFSIKRERERKHVRIGNDSDLVNEYGLLFYITQFLSQQSLMEVGNNADLKPRFFSVDQKRRVLGSFGL